MVSKWKKFICVSESKWKDFWCIIVMALILFVIFIGIEFIILYILIRHGIIVISEIQNVLWPLNAMISFITLIAGRLLKHNEQRIDGDIKLIENFMKFFEIAHNRVSWNEDVWLSTQIAAIYAVAELWKRHVILKNIAKEWLTSISMWKEEDIIKQTEEDVIKQTEKDKIKEIKVKAVDALNYLNSK